MRIGGGGPQSVGTNPAFSQERTEPFGISRNKGKRLNGNDFSYFPGVLNGLFQLNCLPFANLWSLFWNHHARVCGTCSSKWKPLRIKMARGLNGLERIWR